MSISDSQEVLSGCFGGQNFHYKFFSSQKYNYERHQKPSDRVSKNTEMLIPKTEVLFDAYSISCSLCLSLGSGYFHLKFGFCQNCQQFYHHC